MSSDTVLHDLCKGFGSLLSRSKHSDPGLFIEEASRADDRGNLPLHTACCHQPTADVVEVLLKACPSAASQPNANGNLPLHQAAMWQASSEVVEVLLSRYPEAATVRNQYGSLALHLAASNRADAKVVRLLIDAYPAALQLQNDDGMTPLDLAMADYSDQSDDHNEEKTTEAREPVLAMLQNKPAPPELTPREKAEKYQDKARQLERRLHMLKSKNTRQSQDMMDALSAVRRLADRFPHALYSAGIDPNELEIALSSHLEEEENADADTVILNAIRNRSLLLSHTADMTMIKKQQNDEQMAPRDRIEDLLSSVVGLDHIKSQVRGLRRTTEISDLRESHLHRRSKIDPSSFAYFSLLAESSSDSYPSRPKASHMVFVGNPGTGKTAVGRLLAKVYHELGILRKPKFLEVERMDLVGRDRLTTLQKTREVLEEAKGGILFVDEAFTLGIVKRRANRAADANSIDAIKELILCIDELQEQSGNLEFSELPLIILAGFPMEMQQFLASQPELRARFPLKFEFPDYSCLELAEIFRDLCNARGFDLATSDEPSLLSNNNQEKNVVEIISKLLENETTHVWRTERNGRVSEMLFAGARQEVRKRMRAASYEGEDDVDPHLILLDDIENVVRLEFK